VQFTVGIGRLLHTLKAFPAHKTMLDHAILEQEMPPDDVNYFASVEKKVDCQVDDV
jgi:hypothetical protein